MPLKDKYGGSSLENASVDRTLFDLLIFSSVCVSVCSWIKTRFSSHLVSISQAAFSGLQNLNKTRENNAKRNLFSCHPIQIKGLFDFPERRAAHCWEVTKYICVSILKKVS